MFGIQLGAANHCFDNIPRCSRSIKSSTKKPEILDSIVVSISGCHPGDPGSIPGRGVLFFFLLVTRLIFIHLMQYVYNLYLCILIQFGPED